MDAKWTEIHRSFAKIMDATFTPEEATGLVLDAREGVAANMRKDAFRQGGLSAVADVDAFLSFWEKDMTRIDIEVQNTYAATHTWAWNNRR